MTSEDKKWFESRFDRLEDRFDRVEKVQVRQEAVLDEHIRRTELLEASTKALREQVEPLKTHVAIVSAIGKLILGLAALVSAAFGVWKVWHS